MLYACECGVGANAETAQGIWCPYHVPLPVVSKCTVIYACKFRSTDMGDVQDEKLLSHCTQLVYGRFVESFSLPCSSASPQLRLLAMLSVCRSRVLLQ